jgi:small neutral amino acid transporter SnatA (MarC family)
VDHPSVHFATVLIAPLVAALRAVCCRATFTPFGITLVPFRIAGGMSAGLCGCHVLRGQESSVHVPSAEDDARSRDAGIDSEITPFAMRILGVRSALQASSA